MFTFVLEGFEVAFVSFWVGCMPLLLALRFRFFFFLFTWVSIWVGLRGDAWWWRLEMGVWVVWDGRFTACQAEWGSMKLGIRIQRIYHTFVHIMQSHLLSVCLESIWVPRKIVLYKQGWAVFLLDVVYYIWALQVRIPGSGSWGFLSWFPQAEILRFWQPWQLVGLGA